MPQLRYHDTKQPIGHNHGAPPDSYLDTLLGWAKGEKDEVFAQNNNHDIYAMVGEALDLPPDATLLHRKAVLCEVLRVLPGDESDWNFREGRDTTAGPQRPEEMEAGVCQLSYNVLNIAPDLRPYFVANGITNAESFQRIVKDSPELDLAITARVLREPYKRWDGPINRGWIAKQVSKAAVAEFMVLLA